MIVSCACVEITPGYVATRRFWNPAFLPIDLTVFEKPFIAIVTLGTPQSSAAMLARELAAVQLPHPALPEMTASQPYSLSFSAKSLTTSDSLGP